MGTSSSHRSPSTPEWERVKQLYRQANPDPGRVSSRIAQALAAQAPGELAGPGVACCLSSLLLASSDAAAARLPLPPHAPPLLVLSQALREQAEREIAAAGYASRFSDIALNALGTTVFEAGAGGAASVFDIPAPQVLASVGCYAAECRLHELSRCFVAHDFDHLFRHLVTRDTPDFVGRAGLPTVAAASQLRDAVAAYCRAAVTRIEAAVHETVLTEALQVTGPERLRLVGGVLADLTDRGLQQVAAGE